MDTDSLRRHLVALLRWEKAHAGFDSAVRDLPAEHRGAKPPGQPHTPWRLLEHLRIAQWDILEFSRDPDHVSPEWPEGYWPDGAAPPDDRAWEASVAGFRTDLEAFCALVEDPDTDLLAPLPWSEGGTTFLREVLLLADHNAYHLGQLVAVRRLLGCWPPAGGSG